MTSPAGTSRPPAIHVDADACPAQVRRLLEEAAQKRDLTLVFYSDESHEIWPAYGSARQVAGGPDAVDLALVAELEAKDLVVTQDYGLAALALAKKARAIHPDGWLYTAFNIDRLLHERHLSAKQRRAGQRVSGPSKRTEKESRRFARQLQALLDGCA